MPVLHKEDAVTKQDIVVEIARQTGLQQALIKSIVQKILNSIVDVLVSEQRIELRNFGVFVVKERKARKARNPRTGEEVSVPAKCVVTFKPGKAMEERVAAIGVTENPRPGTQPVGRPDGRPD